MKKNKKDLSLCPLNMTCFFIFSDRVFWKKKVYKFHDSQKTKSKGNGVTAKELIEEYESDTIRYYMISHAPERKDSNFAHELLTQLHNKKLVGEYGNFVNRNLAFLVKKFNGVTPCGTVDESVRDKIIESYKIVGDLISSGELKSAIAKVQELVQFANKYYDEHKPWITVKENISEFNNTTVTCLDLIINIANLYEPFIPDSSTKIFSFFGNINKHWEYIFVKPFTTLQDVSVLFNII